MAKGAWQPWGQMKRWKHRALILRGSTQGAFVCYNVEGLKHQTKASREHAHQDIMTTATIVAEGRSTAPHGPLGVLMLGALGVVYGDIGTSREFQLARMTVSDAISYSTRVAQDELGLERINEGCCLRRSAAGLSTGRL